MGLARVNTTSINGASSRFSLQSQDSQLTIFPSCCSSTGELPLPDKIESSFVTANAFNRPFPKSSCLEMVSFLSMSYTSLKDLLPGISTSTQSWDEIPIKNKLVQKAASAYLQPMSSSRERNNPGFFQWLGVACSFHCRSNSECVHGCSCSCGCLEFVNQMIRDVFGRFFQANRSRRNVD